MYIRVGGRASRLAPSWVLLTVLGMAAPGWAQAPVSDAAGSRDVASHTSSSRTTADRQRVTAALNRQPIRFEPLGEKGMFLARGIGAAVRLTGTSIDFPIGIGSRTADSIRVHFVGAKRSRRVTGVDPLPGRVNYLYSDDPKRWRTNVPTYARAHTSELYRGVDVDYYGAGDLLEYDFIVRPGARPDKISLAISGASVAISESGDLVYGSDQRVLLRKPIAYQTVNDMRREVSVEYRWRDDGTLGFAIGAYDRRQSLIIDPIVDYSFTFGGSGYDYPVDIVVDDLGAVYVGGSTQSIDFPTLNPASGRQDAGICSGGQESYTTCSDGFLAKLRPDGVALEYATYFGVGRGSSVTSLAVDASHALYFAGNASTSIPGFPTEYSSFIGKLAPDGSRLLYKFVTPASQDFLLISDLAIGLDGSAYVTTWDGLATLSPTGDNFHSILALPTGPSGSRPTLLYAVAVGPDSVIVAGSTASADFATTPGAVQTQFGGGRDGVIMRLTSDGAVVYSTFLGGSGDDFIFGLSVDSDGAAYVVGDSTSADFPEGRSDIPWDPSAPHHVMITKVSRDGGSIAYATLLSYPYVSLFAGRVAVNSAGDAHTAACAPEGGFYPTKCRLWRVGPTGTLLGSVSGVPLNVFAMDRTGATYFPTQTGTNGGDINITKLAPGVRLTGLRASESLPARFATLITWTAEAIADGYAEYSFVRHSAADGWIEAQAFGPSQTYTWTPASWDVGDHELCVLARLAGSSNTPVSKCVKFAITGVGPGEPPVLAPPADFNADRRPDLLWINSTTGHMAMWNLGGGDHGERVLGGGYLNSPVLPAGWRIAGTADIDGDGRTDLFLQSDTGLLGAWLFDGSTLRAGITLTPGQVGDPNWQIRAVGDLNHDGHPDLIWQYAPTGQVAFWLMNGTSAIGYVIPDVMAPGGDWEIVGTGDSNRDGERDIFWQQRSTGTLAVWWMSGTKIQGASLLSASPGDPKWRAVAVADLDGDAYSDLIFQHTDTRIAAAWYLRDATVRFGATLMPSTVGDPAWKIVGPR